MEAQAGDTVERSSRVCVCQKRLWATSITGSTKTMDDNPDVETLVAGLVADSESTRKYAVFKLQGMLNDPGFADAFIEGDGLPALRRCVLESAGNTQAYALGSLDALLELDLGWEGADSEVIGKVGHGQPDRACQCKLHQQHVLQGPIYVY